jgi:hypothetical protein
MAEGNLDLTGRACAIARVTKASVQSTTCQENPQRTANCGPAYDHPTKSSPVIWKSGRVKKGTGNSATSGFLERSNWTTVRGGCDDGASRTALRILMARSGLLNAAPRTLVTDAHRMVTELHAGQILDSASRSRSLSAAADWVTVFKATDLKTGCSVAVKMLFEVENDRAFLSRFQLEIEMARRLDRRRDCPPRPRARRRSVSFSRSVAM